MKTNNLTMKNIFRVSVIALGFLLVSNALTAREWPVTHPKSGTGLKEAAAGCNPGSAYKFLDINNVRTLIYSYGNGWFLENAQYEIPKGSKKTSMFSFSLWIGGIDMNNNLKLAAYKYGQGPSNGTSHTNNDFWPGPLTIDGTASVTADVCSKYDQLFPMTRDDVTAFLAWFNDPASYPNYTIPTDIKNWPGNAEPSKGQSLYLAPFFDQNGDGVYDPTSGDYPYYDLTNDLCPSKLKAGERQRRAHVRNGEATDTAGILVDQVIKGDQTLWSVYNDKGNYHSETQGAPIGMEIRAQYFAFSTNDEINNMTFYSYEIINRSTYTLSGTYFSQWVDPDLGYAWDDYVQCDVARGLGICYNGKPIDGTGQTEAYGSHPPAVGVDFFQGPYLDPDGYDNPSFNGPGIKGPSFKNMPNKCDIVTYDNQVIDMTWGANGEYSGPVLVKAEAINGVNFGDGIIDNERFGMRRFVYHNNSGVASYMLDPAYAPQYYNYLKGIWMDNTKMIYGGNGNLQGGGYGPACDFMFPGDSDPCLWGTHGLEPNKPGTWTEATAGNNPSDRRFMQSAGEFTLLPGACNYITVGIPWARTISGDNLASIPLLQQADDKCQTLFDNCFAVLNGPNAPDLTIEELNQELIIYLSNKKTNDPGSNYQEKYVEYDPTIQTPPGVTKRYDSLYHFEGYQIFQLKDATVSAADLGDATKARQVAQCDIKNGFAKLVDWTYDPNLGGNSGTVMVDGADAGINHSFVLTTDLFSQGDPTFINHKQYYYMAIAYAYNNYKTYNQADPTALDGQKKTYLSGRNNIKQYTAIPHIPVGTVINSSYGEGPEIIRIEGQGNGGMILDLTQATIDSIMMKPPSDSVTNPYGSPDYPIAYRATYKVGYGPLGVKVIDPLNVPTGKYMVKLDSMVAGPTGNPFYNKNIKFGHWTMIDLTSYKTYRSDTTTIYPYESLFVDLGIALTINQVPLPGDSVNSSGVASNNGLLWAPPAIYQDSSKMWLSGVPDNDIPSDPRNWIRAGTYYTTNTTLSKYNDYNMDANPQRPWDPNKSLGKLQTLTVPFTINGVTYTATGATWAPYVLAAGAEQVQNKVGPAYSLAQKAYAFLQDIPSVDVVFTPDKSKWTRCPVIELCPDSALSQGHALPFTMRKAASLNIDGVAGVVSSDPKLNSDYINPTGMSWFPGYAINIETGERLNIMFGENSWLGSDNGSDMLFNPTSRIYNPSGTPVFGGQHYVYIMGHLTKTDPFTLTYPAYDGGAFIVGQFIKSKQTNLDIYRKLIFGTALYTTIPLSVDGVPWLDNQVTIKIRVNSSYQRYYSTSLPKGITDTLNRNYPVYQFNTNAVASSVNNQDKASTDLDLINVVPNPYYAYDDYEHNQLDNRIKIVNLPLKCTVSIFDLSGVLIRQFVVDKSSIVEPRSSTLGINTDSKTSIDWDLKNFAGIPISGGVYLIHVKADNLGERTLRWFGILRPVDLNSL
jgi:hypothetical protein